MEAKVESIMTGEGSVEEILKANKEKIQTLTQNLEEIVRKGYFKIITNTEAMQNLWVNEEVPQIFVPADVEIKKHEETKHEKPEEDLVWELINEGKLSEAAKIVKSSKKKTVFRIGRILSCSEYYNVFEKPNGIDRLKAALELWEGDHAMFIANFLLDQLTTKKDRFQELFIKTRQILAELIEEKDEQKIEGFFQENLKGYLEEVKETLISRLNGSNDLEDLCKFITEDQPKFGIPGIWEIISQDWENKAEEIIYKNCEVAPAATLDEAVMKYEQQTKPVLALFEAHRSLLSLFHLKISKNLSSVIKSRLPAVSPVLLLGFFTNFYNMSISSLFPDLDFADIIQDLQKSISSQFSNQDVLRICIEIKSICGNTPISLTDLKVNFGPSQAGFGSIIGQHPCESSENRASLPTPKPAVELISLPITLSAHLILT